MTLIPEYFNLFDYFLGDDRLEEIGVRTAIEFRGSRITYRELRAEVDHWRERLVASGVTEGDRVALLLYDSPEFISCFLAAVSVGAIAVPINTYLSPQEVTYIIADSGARVVIAEDDLDWKVNLAESSGERGSLILIETSARHYLEAKDEAVEQIQLPATTRDSPAFILYTSGSTGAPKGVLHKHGAVVFTVEAFSKSVLMLRPEDRVYSASRLFFAYGLGNSLSFPLAAGATVILEMGKPAPERLAALFEEESPTVFFGVPAVYRALLDHHRQVRTLDTSAIRLCVSAGEALPGRILLDWKQETGLTIVDGIGSTEMLHIFISNTEGDARTGSSGKVVPGYEVRLLADDGAEVLRGEAGSLWVKGASATAGYWRRQDMTRETIVEGWVRTGDIYRSDEDGFYYHIGRTDDCFKVKGLWVSPVEVESVLLMHESVAEAAVVARTDKDGLATVTAFVVIRTGREHDALKKELREFAASHLSQHKVPGVIEVLDEMPRTSTGKIQRYKLRAAGRINDTGGSDDN